MKLMLILGFWSLTVVSYAMDLDARFGVEVYIIETLLSSSGSSRGSHIRGRTFNHQGLRFVGNGVSKEAHFGRSGLEVCDEGCYGVSPIRIKKVGHLDKTVGQCTRWCERWGHNRPYLAGGVCWNMVSAFLNAHNLGHPAADKGQCALM